MRAAFSCQDAADKAATRALSLYAFSTLAACLHWLAAEAVAQEAVRNSIVGEAAAEARHRQSESLPYTIKSGDLRLLITPSFAVEYNDNVYISHRNRRDDIILRPLLGVEANYPLTSHNLFQADVTFGYEQFVQHDDLSSWYVRSGSQLSFDVLIKDFLINLHDRITVVQDPATEAGVADTGRYGYFQNVLGLQGTWDLRDLLLSAGYDHLTFLSLHKDYDYTERASEMIFFQAAMRLYPQLTAGVEGSVSFTSYDQQVLNDNNNYSGGIYADWRPGSGSFRLRPRFGYTAYDFDQTSEVYKAHDQDGWYVDLTATHQFSTSMSYSLSGGHEFRFGIESDLIEDWYIRPGFNWGFAKDMGFTAMLSYEHGEQVGDSNSLVSGERYDWFGANFGLTYSATRRLAFALNYRLTFRSSSFENRDYTQNRIGLMVTYSIQ